MKNICALDFRDVSLFRASFTSSEETDIFVVVVRRHVLYFLNPPPAIHDYWRF